MSLKTGISFPSIPPSSNTNSTLYTIEVDSDSEEESSQNTQENDDDIDDDDYSTTTEPHPPISKIPIFISSPKVPDDIVLPNIPSHVSYTESETGNSNVSAIYFDPSSLETSHISSIIIESTNDTPKTKTQSIEEEDYKITSSSSSSISIKHQSTKQQSSSKPHFTLKQPNKKDQNVKEPKEQNIKQQTPKEQNIKQTGVKQKNLKQISPKSQYTSSYSNQSSSQTVVNLPTPKDKKIIKKEPSDDESIDIYTSSDTMTCQSGTFSDYSTTTSMTSTTKEKHQNELTEDSSLSANETIKTYVDDDTKAAQRMIPPPEPPTVCCMLV